MWDAIWIHANIATMADKDYGCIENAAIACKDGVITWIGEISDLDAPLETLAKQVHDVSGKWITPGLIDCHTHLVFGGNRAKEFEMRLNGVSYEEIAKAGGGILSTVNATRQASEDELYKAAFPRLKALMAEGVTGIEIKSGYGLDTETETKMLRVATRLRDECGLKVQRTFLGAHALPPEYKDNADGYIQLVCEEMIPAVTTENLCDAIDGFCENIAFNTTQIETVFNCAKDKNIPVKLHAEQLSDQGGAKLAASYQALSADHLEYLDEEGVKAMANSGTVAVILPGAFYFLRETKKPPIELFRKHNVPMALATDLNPGSSPAHSLLLMMNMGCTFFFMTPEETLSSVTKHAAQALGWHDRGTLEKGKVCDFVIWDIESPAELSYKIGYNPCINIIQNGALRTG